MFYQDYQAYYWAYQAYYHLRLPSLLHVLRLPSLLHVLRLPSLLLHIAKFNQLITKVVKHITMVTILSHHKLPPLHDNDH